MADRGKHSSSENNNTAWIAADSEATRLILLRHGVTPYSIEKRFAGRSDLQLLPLGQTQAAAAAGRIRRLAAVDRIYSSPLVRTRQTAAAVGAELGLPVLIEDDLVETDFGSWDGFTFDQVRDREPAAIDAWIADPELAPPGGESLVATAARVLAARDRILAAHAGQTVVLVTHVSPIKALVTDAVRAPVSSAHRMYLAPASISVVDYYPNGAVSLRSFNDTSHL